MSQVANSTAKKSPSEYTAMTHNQDQGHEERRSSVLDEDSLAPMGCDVMCKAMDEVPYNTVKKQYNKDFHAKLNEARC